jgi:hypothetical protein
VYKKSFFILSLFFLSTCVFAQEQAFKEGEWLEFKVKYGWFNASVAGLEIQTDTLNGKEVYRILGFGRTTGLLDVFFKVRDHYESYIDKDEVKPYKFIRDLSEGGYIKNKMILFNHENNTATVHDYKYDTIHKHPFTEATQDMISGLYYLRNKVDTKTLKKGDFINVNLFFDEKNHDFKTKYLGREVVETSFGDVTCLMFRPYVMSGRVFKEQESVTVWISDDKNKIPIKVEAELAVGSITAKLDKFKGLKHPFKINM